MLESYLNLGTFQILELSPFGTMSLCYYCTPVYHTSLSASIRCIAIHIVNKEFPLFFSGANLGSSRPKRWNESSLLFGLQPRRWLWLLALQSNFASVLLVLCLHWLRLRTVCPGQTLKWVHPALQTTTPPSHCDHTSSVLLVLCIYRLRLRNSLSKLS